MPTTIVTASGRTRVLPEDLEPGRVAGLDPEGRIVVDDFSARNPKPPRPGSIPSRPFMFALTLCCDAYDKGSQGGAVCRGCYGVKGPDTGAYLYRADDGSFPGLDPVIEPTGPGSQPAS